MLVSAQKIEEHVRETDDFARHGRESGAGARDGRRKNGNWLARQKGERFSFHCRRHHPAMDSDVGC